MQHREDAGLVDSAKEEGLVDPDSPRSESIYNALVGWCVSCGDKRGSYRGTLVREMFLNELESHEKWLERSWIHRLVRELRLSLKECIQALLLKHSLRFVVEKNRVTVESNPYLRGNLIIDCLRRSTNKRGRKAHLESVSYVCLLG